MIKQRGGFVMGLVLGLLLGLAVALGVALYITKAPVPFVNKVPPRTAEQDRAEAERNRNWDPNAPLAGRPRAGADAAPAAPDVSAPALPEVPGSVGGASVPRDPAAILSGAPAPVPAAAPLPPAPAPPPPVATAATAFVYFVQAGAYTRGEDAEQQRARLAMMGQVARITEREQAGRVVYRVRVGPYPERAEADALQLQLQEQGIEAQIVRVEKP